VRARRAARAPASVAVIGGGPAGTAAAVAARAHGLEVELLHFVRPPARAGESLPPGCEPLLDELFGEGAVSPEAHRSAYGNEAAWGRDDLASVDFLFSPFGRGWHVDRAALDRGLLARAEAAGVTVHRGARLSQATWGAEGWEVRAAVSDGAVRRSPAVVLIDATGRAARVARSQGARRRRLDRLVAACWELQAEREDPDTSTTVEAAPEGWWYTHAVPGRRRMIGFLTDADLLSHRGARGPHDGRWEPAPPPRVRDALERGGYRAKGPARICDASTSYLDPLTGPGWIAAGDAAVSFDPLSSQGMITALLMGREAGRAAAAACLAGDVEPLSRYAEGYAALLHEHLIHQAAHYDAEPRWPTSPFWSRRGRRPSLLHG